MLNRIKILKKPKVILVLILLLTAFLRLYRLDYPNKYVFDEVYHAYTAKEYLKGNRDAWSPWGKSLPGVAFEWLHPPVEKEMMAASMFIFRTTDVWAYRLPGALLGILSVFLVYKLALILFKNEAAALLSALIFSLDGLVFVQSRIGMNDVYLVAFILASIIFFVQKRYIIAALFMGVAMATKWPGVFLVLMFFPILLYRRQYKKLIYFFLIPPTVYLLSYTHYFLMGYNWNDFIELHNQIWWYQTHLEATHPYSSPWWSWPLNLYPVWYFVDYQKNSIANIFASGNPLVFWTGSIAILATTWETVKKRSIHLMIVLLGFLVFWLPWAASPRIMFLYHFSPSVPFLSLALGYQLNTLLNDEKGRKLVILLLFLIILSFILIFPFLTGLPIPRDLVKLFFMTNLSKNPF
ncbi:MAG: phospholipid carrier-dependent glycosyltransferase [Candidatus Daviesbacteria bacterium]|nr:phospholipid carrier-dependent glycosyltransferase [Candidatus Daviesbacteria bacterium]